MLVFWQVEDQGAVVRRAIHHRDRLKEKFARGENPLLSQDTSQAAADWDGEKSRAGASAKCASTWATALWMPSRAWRM